MCLPDFLDDDPETDDFDHRPHLPLRHPDGDDLHDLAADYERRAIAYHEDTAREAAAAEPHLPVFQGTPEPRQWWDGIKPDATKKQIFDARVARDAVDAAEGQLPVEPSTWVFDPKTKSVAFVLRDTELYLALANKPSPPADVVSKAGALDANYPPPKRDKEGKVIVPKPKEKELVGYLLSNDTGKKVIDVGFRKSYRPPMKRKKYPAVNPTPEQRLPFASSIHRPLLYCEFQDPSPALMPGDRVYTENGPHETLNGYILQLRDVWDKKRQPKQLVTWAKVVAAGPMGRYTIRTASDGVWVELAHLVRHGLDFPYQFLRNDRVRVVAGIFKGAEGRVVDITGALLTIALPRDVAIGPYGLGVAVIGSMGTITVEMNFVSRLWHLGDSVRVRWPPHSGHIGRRGVIVRMAYGVLSIFDVRVCQTF